MRSSLLALAILCCVPPASAAAPLRRVHVVIVCDTECGPTATLKACARAGGRLMYELMHRKLPTNRRTITLLTGRMVSPQGVLTTLSRLHVRPDEGLFVYTISHGSFVSGHGHVFNFSGGNIPRRNLMAAMLAKRAGLTVLYTECCSNYERGFKAVPNPASDLDRPHERGANVIADLLLRNRGVVDITAARPGQSASARTDCGGNLTGALFLVGTRVRPGDLDRNRDGVVTWREAWPAVYGLVGQLYKSARIKGQNTQQPACYAAGR